MAVKQNGMKRTKPLDARGAKRQFHQLAVFFGNILIRVDTVNIWLGFGIGGLTMAEYIERDALRKVLKNWRDAHADVDDEEGCGLLEDVIWEVDAQTAADVAPVVHARWIDDGRGIIICPECKRGYNLHAKYTHYCPNCGAKMDGGDGDAAD